MVQRNDNTGEREIVEERNAALVSVGIGRRRYSISNIGKGLTALVAAAVAAGAVVGTVLHIIGWDFVSVRGRELTEIKAEIGELHRTDTVQLNNQRAQRAALDTIARSSERTSRYLCYFMRRYEPSALEPGDPCQPVNVPTSRKR